MSQYTLFMISYCNHCSLSSLSSFFMFHFPFMFHFHVSFRPLEREPDSSFGFPTPPQPSTSLLTSFIFIARLQIFQLNIWNSKLTNPPLPLLYSRTALYLSIYQSIDPSIYLIMKKNTTNKPTSDATVIIVVIAVAIYAIYLCMLVDSRLNKKNYSLYLLFVYL